MQSSTTPEWKLKCFHWLPIERWTPETILGDYKVDGKRYCKICDEWVPNNEREVNSHIRRHIREENARAAKVKAENAERARIAKEEAAREKRLVKENIAAVEGKPQKAAPARIGRPRKSKTPDSVVDSKLREFLTKSGEATVASLVEATGIEIASVRAWIKDTPGVSQTGFFKSGGRGRPAPMYGLAKSTTKEG